MILPEIQNSFLAGLIHLDQEAFLTINTQFISQLGDAVFPILRNPKTWIPLYALLAIFVIVRFKKKSIPWIIFAILCVTLTDQVSSHFLKSLFGRLRPCQDPTIKDIARLLVSRCPGNASFTSSHAVNHFGIAAFFYFSLKPSLGKWSLLFFLWALSICYAQVYVGVHYPGDVIVGGILGFGLGSLISFFFIKFFNFGITKNLKP